MSPEVTGTNGGDDSESLHASLESSTVYDSLDHDGKVATAIITVVEDGEPVGRFTAQFIESARGELTADWSTVETGIREGIYSYDDQSGEPPFWPVEEVVDELKEAHPHHEFGVINSGPNDI